MKSALLLILLAACGGKSEKSIEELKTAHLAKITARLALMPKVYEVANGLVDESAKPPPLDFSNLDDASKNIVNAIAVQVEDLGSPKRDASPQLRFAEGNEDQLRMAKKFAGVKVEFEINNWPYFEYMLANFEDAKYVLVVKPTRVAKGQASFSGSFSAGTVVSTNVLVELATMTAIGSFESTAHNDDKIILGKYADKDPQPHVDKDLGANWGRAIAEGIGKRWPGSTTPWTWGLGY